MLFGSPYSEIIQDFVPLQRGQTAPVSSRNLPDRRARERTKACRPADVARRFPTRVPGREIVSERPEFRTVRLRELVGEQLVEDFGMIHLRLDGVVEIGVDDLLLPGGLFLRRQFGHGHALFLDLGHDLRLR